MLVSHIQWVQLEIAYGSHIDLLSFWLAMKTSESADSWITAGTHLSHAI